MRHDEAVVGGAADDVRTSPNPCHPGPRACLTSLEYAAIIATVVSNEVAVIAGLGRDHDAITTHHGRDGAARKADPIE